MHQVLSVSIIIAIVALSSSREGVCQSSDDSDFSDDSNPAASQLFNQIIFDRISNLTTVFQDDIKREFGFCITDV